jgi:hypothetical protein
VQRPAWDAGDSQVLPESILVWSAGKDLNEMSPQDNIKTW